MITIHNYEVYIMDYLEGTLPKELVPVMEVFLEKHPDIKEEVAELTDMVLIPNEAIVFPDKAALLNIPQQQQRRVLPIWQRKNWLNALALAAMLTGCIWGAQTFWQIQLPSPSQSPMVERAADDRRQTADGRRQTADEKRKTKNERQKTKSEGQKGKGNKQGAKNITPLPFSELARKNEKKKARTEGQKMANDRRQTKNDRRKTIDEKRQTADEGQKGEGNKRGVKNINPLPFSELARKNTKQTAISNKLMPTSNQQVAVINWKDHLPKKPASPKLQTPTIALKPQPITIIPQQTITSLQAKKAMIRQIPTDMALNHKNHVQKNRVDLEDLTIVPIPSPTKRVAYLNLPSLSNKKVNAVTPKANKIVLPQALAITSTKDALDIPIPSNHQTSDTKEWVLIEEELALSNLSNALLPKMITQQNPAPLGIEGNIRLKITTHPNKFPLLKRLFSKSTVDDNR